MRKKDDKQKPIMYGWLKLVFSFKGIWCFLPGILGMFFVYWAEAKGYHALILKEYHEPLAIGLLSIAAVFFLSRSFIYRLEIDFILTAVAVNFLCREIHFKGTDNAVVIAVAVILIWVLLRKNQIWASIGQVKLFQLSLTGTAFTYFFSILIARRVFSIDNLPILPNEEYMYDRLEEVMENIAHLFLIFSGIVAFFIHEQRRKHSKFGKSLATKALSNDNEVFRCQVSGVRPKRCQILKPDTHNLRYQIISALTAPKGPFFRFIRVGLTLTERSIL